MGLHFYAAAIAAGLAATVIFLVVRVKKGGIPGLYTKSIASFCFIATALAATNKNSTFIGYASLMIFGLVMGMLGDIWLDLKWIQLENKDSYLYSGFISFLVGHLFYISAIYLYSPWTAPSFAAAVIGAVVIAVIATLMEKPLKMNYGKFKTILFLYSLVLAFTVTSSVVTAIITRGETVWVVMSVGAILFLLSDLVLSGIYFGEGKNTPVNVVVNHTLYYMAQFIMASTIFFIK